MSQARSGYSYMYNEGPSPFVPLMLIGMVVMWIALPYYFSYEPAIEEAQEQWNLMLIILTLLLLLVIIYLAYNSSADLSGANVFKYVMPQSDPSSIHRVGGSPIGLGILLLIVLTMVWYHSDFIDSWNPLVRSR